MTITSFTSELPKLPELPTLYPTIGKALEDTLYSFIEKYESINNQTMQILTDFTEGISKLKSALIIQEKRKFPS